MWVLQCCAMLLLLLVMLLPEQVYLLPYTPQDKQQCLNPSREYYEENIQKCCSLCRPGYKLLERCTEDSDTQCVACNEETYTKSWSRADLCLRCSPKCTKGLVEVKECTQTQNRICWCPSDQFCNRNIFGTCSSCQLYRRCKPGYEVSVPGTNSKDVECAPCRPGTFSDVESHNATCRPHRICISVRIPGNGTHDAVCQETSVSVDIMQTTPLGRVFPETQMPSHHSLTKSPALNTKAVQQPPKSDVSYVAVLVAGVMFAVCTLLAGTVFCSAFRKKVPHCVLPFGSKKQPLSVEKASGKWPQNIDALGQEEQNLLQISTSSSGSLDSPAGSEKTSEVISTMSSSTTEAESMQQRSSLTKSFSHHGGDSAKQPNSSTTHVNISCVVNVCSSDHSMQFQSLDGPACSDSGNCTLAEEDIPLSKEERPLKRELKEQIAVEVEEDHLDPLPQVGGKSLPLSIQDVGMKTR